MRDLLTSCSLVLRGEAGTRLGGCWEGGGDPLIKSYCAEEGPRTVAEPFPLKPAISSPSWMSRGSARHTEEGWRAQVEETGGGDRSSGGGMINLNNEDTHHPASHCLFSRML